MEKKDRNEKADYRHVYRIIMLAVGVIVVVATLRVVLTPKSFGKYGHYRADNMDEIMAQPTKYSSGSDTCEGCHDENYSEHEEGKHKGLKCETCHGPAAKHTDDPATAKNPVKPVKREHCGLCHGKKLTRPKNFPQIDLDTHNEGVPCVDCHNPHTPAL